MSIQELENQKQELQTLVDRRDLARRVTASTDFKELILKEFCVNEVARSVALTTDLNLKEDQRKICLSMSQAGGHLVRWLHAIEAMGDSAEEDIRQLDEEIANLRQQGEDD